MLTNFAHFRALIKKYYQVKLKLLKSLFIFMIGNYVLDFKNTRLDFLLLSKSAFKRLLDFRTSSYFKNDFQKF